MPKNRLVHLFHPGNVLGAMCSVEWLARQADGGEGAGPTVLIHSPVIDATRLESITEVIASLCECQGWPRPRVLTDEDMYTILGPEAVASPQAASRFSQWLGGPPPDEIHYVHTVLGHAAELSMRAYPKARRICFGDALGILHNAGYHMAQYAGASAAEREAAGRAYAKAAANGEFPQADTVACLLPADQKGDYLHGKKLLVVPRQTASDIIDRCVSGLSGLKEYTEGLLRRLPSPRFLFLTENLVEACFATFENGVLMQEEMIRRHAPPGSSVIIKAHPLSSLDVHGELARRLAGDYAVEVFDDKAGRYPLEFMKTLVEACQPLCWSYCTLSIEYLYGKKIPHVIDDELTRRYLEPLRWESIRNSMGMVTGSLANLDAWDGKGPLWSGDYSS